MSFFLATVENEKKGLRKTDLSALFYGDGQIETASSPKERLLTWEVIDSEELMDTFSFVLENNDLTLFDSPLLEKGNVIKFRYGVPGRMSPEFEGVINSRSGWRIVTVGGHFKSEIVISNKQATEKFKNKKLSDIAKELFEREGFRAIVDDTKIVNEVTWKTNETVMQFLKRKSAEAGGAYQVYIEQDTAFFVKKRLDRTPIMTLKYGNIDQEDQFNTLGEPNFVDEQENVATEETVKGFDMLKGEAVEEKANNSSSTQTSLGKGTYYFDEAAGTRKFRPPAADRTGETGRITPTSKQKSEEAKQEAASSFDKKNAKQFSLSWSIDGDATVKAKNIVQVDCRSKAISGKWYIKEAVHRGDTGAYQTDLSLERNALGTGAVGAEQATPEGGENTKGVDNLKSNKVVYVFDEERGIRVPKRN